MNNLNLKPVATIAAACALSLVSATAFAADRMHGSGAQGASSTTRTSAPTTRQDTMTNTSRPWAMPAATTARPTATTAKPTTPSAKATTTAHATGQPNASCEDTPNQPGHSISAPGSAFNPDGTAGTKYAGEQPQNSVNPKSVSQYDVACARPQH